MGYIVGVDIGGTFTDCIVIRSSSDGAPSEVRIGKASSTPPDFQTGFVDALRSAAGQFDIELDAMLRETQGIYHGCTVGTNALVEHRTAKVGLLTTRGHEDTIFMMLAGGRLRRMPAEYIAHVAAQSKPEPLVTKNMCEGVHERITFDGNVIVELNEERARESIQRLLDQGTQAIAISLLWSTVNDAHEQRLKELVLEMAPDAFVSVSAEVIARSGEYERTVATVVNALIGPPMRAYLEQLERDLRDLGYEGSLQIMSCSGGLIDSAHASRLPVLTIGSGPVAGLIGATNLARSGDGASRNIITGDMGGTTFDVGLIFNGEPISRPTASYDQYEYFVPTLDVRSVGAGGGSIISSDGDSLRVGPKSAGARPGPASFGRGGTNATVTDANVVLGMLNPDYFLGGRLSLDVEAARAALSRAGAPIGYDAERTAASALKIVDNQMADAIRLTTIQQGHDVRNFIMYAYGGGGALHATAIAREIGIKQVVIPLSNFAAGWSAFGVAASDALVVEEVAVPMTYPFDGAVLSRHFRQLEQKTRHQLERQGVAASMIETERYVDMRYAVQLNQIEIRAPADEEYDDKSLKTLLATFEDDYERLFGKGSGYAGAGFALNALRVRARAQLSDIKFDVVSTDAADRRAPVPKSVRSVIWYERSAEREDAPVYDGAALQTGDSLAGPAIVEYPDTTVILRHGNHAEIDGSGSMIIEIEGKQRVQSEGVL